MHLVLPTLLLILPVAAHASSGSFVNSPTLWVAFGIGFVTSVVVLRSGHKIGGGALGLVYKHFGIGMLIMSIAILGVVVPPWAGQEVVARTHDLLVVVAFGIMAYGARRMLVAAGLEKK